MSIWITKKLIHNKFLFVENLAPMEEDMESKQKQTNILLYEYTFFWV